MPAEVSELLAALDRFLERAAGAAQKGDQAKLVRTYKAAIAGRFRAQRDWFLAHALPHLKAQVTESARRIHLHSVSMREAETDDVIAESISALLDTWLDDPELRKQFDLLTKLAVQAGVGYLEVSIDTEAFTAALADLLVKRGGLAYQFGLDNPRAVKYLAEHAFESLARSLDRVTADRMKTIILDGLESGGNYNRIASAIRAEFNDMSRARATTIATYEMGEAYSQGMLAAGEDLAGAGLEMEKQWLTAQDSAVSDECEENESAGWIDLDDDFPSGDEAPLAHPNCRCALQVRTKPVPVEVAA